MNTQNVTSQPAKTAAKKTALKVVAASKVTAFLNSREKSGLTVAFHETKSKRLGDKFNARYVKNLANQIAKTESTDKVVVSSASVINDFRQNKFSETRLNENRIRAYKRQLEKSAGFALTDDDVKRDIVRQAALIWKSGKF